MYDLKMTGTAAALVLFLLFMPWPTLADPQPRPLCTTQFAIAAEACSNIVVEDSLQPSMEPLMQLFQEGDHENNNATADHKNGNGNENDSVSAEHENRSSNENEHKSKHRNGKSSGHKSKSARHSKKTGNGHNSHTHNSHSHEYHHPKTNNVCCRWLKEVDNSCICAILYRLPVFLSRPKHTFKVTVGNTCEVTYNCKGRAVVRG